MPLEIIDEVRNITKIKVIGVGGGGGNAINSIAAANLYGVELVAVNTDKQALERSKAHLKVQIGVDITKGLGAGADPAIGRQAALEDRDALAAAIEGADMVFITAGMGGGTGTGAAPVIASLAKEMGVLTVSIVTKPFKYEGRKRLYNAEEGIKEIKKYSDTYIVIPNDRIKQIAKGLPLVKAFEVADDVLRQSIQGISDIILVPGHINVDFADVKSVMSNSGRAVIGMGVAQGEDAAIEAARQAISNQLLEDTSIQEAKGILLNITGGLDFSVESFEAASSLICNEAHEDANIIIGHVVNADLIDEVRITVIATGIEGTQLPIDIPGTSKVFISSTTSGQKSRNIDTIISKRLDTLDTLQKQTTSLAGIHDPSTDPTYEPIEETIPKTPETGPSTLPAEDEYDVPTFIRKQRHPTKLNSGNF